MQWYHILLIIIAIIFILMFIIYLAFIDTFTNKKRLHSVLSNDTPYAKYIDIIKKNKEYFDTVEDEEVYIESFDGLKLKAHYVNSGNSNKLLIFFHGFKSSYKTDLTNAKSYVDKGYSLLMIEQRAHGDSEGKYITFGVKERYDALSWCEYAVNRFGSSVEIVMVGVSMGASTIMMASDLNLPKQVKGMICDCGFNTPKAEIAYCIKHYYHLPSKILVNILDLYCRVFAKFSLAGANSSKSLENSTIPILMIHGDGDDFVPYQYSLENFASCKMDNKELLTIKCDVHAASYLEEMELYNEKVSKFLNSINF